MGCASRGRLGHCEEPLNLLATIPGITQVRAHAALYAHLGHKTAIVALAHKLLGVVYAVLRDLNRCGWQPQG